MAEHAKLPWTTDEEPCGTITRVLSSDGIMLVHAHSYPKYSTKHPDRDGRKANAALIIKAVNSHHAMVNALQDIIQNSREKFAVEKAIDGMRAVVFGVVMTERNDG
jgi:ketopantoate reductase